MGFLGVLGLGLVDARAGGQVALAIAGADRVARRLHPLGRHVDPVGAHVGDVPGLVEPLGRAHGPHRPEAELARGFLLQGRGHERRVGVAAGRLGLDREDAQRHRLDGGDRGLGCCLIGEVEAVQPGAIERGQPGLEAVPRRGRQDRLDRPVFARAEGFDLHLALDHQAQRHRLHPPGRAGARQFAPQHRRQGEPDQVVQRPARQIGVDQFHVDVARVRHRLGDGAARDGVENDTPDLGGLRHRAPLAQRLQQVPRDRLALAGRIGGEDQLVVVLQRLGDGADVFSGFRIDLPGHFEPVGGIDRAVLGGQVADMAVGGQNRVALPQIAVDGLGFSRGFDDDNGHGILLDGAGMGAEREHGSGGPACQHRA